MSSCLCGWHMILPRHRCCKREFLVNAIGREEKSFWEQKYFGSILHPIALRKTSKWSQELGDKNKECKSNMRTLGVTMDSDRLCKYGVKI